ncbi:hypothetical protein D3C72_1736010 [compost metagenome]
MSNILASSHTIISLATEAFWADCFSVNAFTIYSSTYPASLRADIMKGLVVPPVITLPVEINCNSCILDN